MANKKFSEFTLKTDSANVDFVVGYDGTDNVRIAPSNLSSGGASSLNGLTDCSVTSEFSQFIGNVPSGVTSGNAFYNTCLGHNALESLTGGAYNTVIGFEAGDAITSNNKNTVFGAQAFSSSNSANVTAIGYAAGNAASGNDAVYVGYQAGKANTADRTIAIGYQAGYSQTSGSENTNIGFKAGYSNTSSGSNTKVGYECAYHNTGQQTAALGYRALYGSSGASSGSYNTAMGRESGVAVTSGSQNTLIGAAAGKVITTGGNNTVIGSFAGFNTVATGSNNILIGQNSASSSSSVSNEVNLFNGSVVARFQGSASAWSFVSDARDKKDIEDLNLGLDFISKLKPRKFKWNLRDSEVDKNKEASGFVAQEVKEVLDEMNLNYTGIVDTNNPNQYTISQANIIPMLVKAIQELKLELDNCKNCK